MAVPASDAKAFAIGLNLEASADEIAEKSSESEEESKFDDILPARDDS